MCTFKQWLGIKNAAVTFAVSVLKLTGIKIPTALLTTVLI
jgi:hypothetical protein